MKYKINLSYDVEIFKKYFQLTLNNKEQEIIKNYNPQKQQPILAFYNVLTKYGVRKIYFNNLFIDTEEDLTDSNISKQQALNILLGLDSNLNSNILENMIKSLKKIDLDPELLFYPNKTPFVFVGSYIKHKKTLDNFFCGNNCIGNQDFIRWAVDNGFLIEKGKKVRQETKDKQTLIEQKGREILKENPKFNKSSLASALADNEEIGLSIETIRKDYLKWFEKR
jgi:hypothetical protein